MDEIAALTPTFTGVSYEKIDQLGSIQWPCNEQAPNGTPTMHVGQFVRGKGKFYVTAYVPTNERTSSSYPLLLTTGRVLTQYNVGAQTRRTANLAWHSEDRLELHPHDAEARGIDHGDWVGVTSRAGDTVLRVEITDRVAPGVVYTTFHFPESGANLITTENSDWATNCPEYKVTAVQVVKVAQPAAWQVRRRRPCRRARGGASIGAETRSADDPGRRTPGRDGQRHRGVLRCRAGQDGRGRGRALPYHALLGAAHAAGDHRAPAEGRCRTHIHCTLSHRKTCAVA